MAIKPPEFCVNLMVADPCPTDDVEWKIVCITGTWAGKGKPTVNGVPLAAPGGRIELSGEPDNNVVDGCITVQTCNLYANVGGDSPIGGAYNYTVKLESSDGQTAACPMRFVIDADATYELVDGCIPFDQVAVDSAGTPAGSTFDAQVKAIAQTCVDQALADAAGPKGGEIHPPEWAGVVEASRALFAGSINTTTNGSLGPLRTMRLNNPGSCEACALIYIDWGQHWGPSQADGRIWVDGYYSIAVNAAAPTPNVWGSLEGRDASEDIDGLRGGQWKAHPIGDRVLTATIPPGGFVEVKWQARLRLPALGSNVPATRNIYGVSGAIKGVSNGQ